jgi:glycosyltransferase involved in cell wall biosynthesis
MKCLWLRPSTGDNISLRRTRIAEQLGQRGIDIDIQDASGRDALAAIRRALFGDYDVIMGNVRIGLYLGFPLAKLRGRPFIGTVSDPIEQIEDLPGPVFTFLRWYEWQILARADACSFTYQSSYEEAKRRGVDGQKLPNAVDFRLFHDPDPDTVSQAEHILVDNGVDLDAPIGIYIGGMTDETYNLAAILEAAERLSEWEFVFVGEGPDQDLVESAAAGADNVTFLGAFEYELMPGFLAHATVGFCLVDAEQPLKVAEYGAAGLVCLGIDGELRNRFDDDELYFVEPTGESVAAALAALGSDPQLREEYADQLGQAVKSVGWDDIADAFEDMVRSVADE